MLRLPSDIIHREESHPTNYSSNFISDLMNIGLLLHGCQIVEGLSQFELLIWKLVY
jgi:hypothetical protein